MTTLVATPIATCAADGLVRVQITYTVPASETAAHGPVVKAEVWGQDVFVPGHVVQYGVQLTYTDGTVRASDPATFRVPRLSCPADTSSAAPTTTAASSSSTSPASTAVTTATTTPASTTTPTTTVATTATTIDIGTSVTTAPDLCFWNMICPTTTTGPVEILTETSVSRLPTTGGNVSTVGYAGVALFVAGVALVLIGRRGDRRARP